MPTGIGAKSFISIGREAVWGTKVAATQTLEIVEESVELQPGFIRDPSLFNQRERRGIYAAGYFYRGPIRIRANYVGMIQLLDALFGTATFGSRGVVPTGTGPWTIPFKILTLLNSYTIEIVEGDIPATKCQVLVGAKVRGARFVVEAAQSEAGMMTIELDVIAKDKLDTQTPTTNFARTGTTATGTPNITVLPSTDHIFVGMPLSGTGIPVGATVASIVSTTAITMSANASASGAVSITFTLTPAPVDPVLFTQGTVVDDGINTAGIIVKRVEISLQQPTTEADRMGIGSALINEPLPNDFLTAQWTIKEEFANVGLLQAAHAGTLGSPEFRFASPVAGNFIRFRSVQARITAFPGEPIRSYGVIEQDVTWETFKDSTNSDGTGLFIEVVSTTENGGPA